jgi:predicted pyridoxine 5'-phosphate oxidase superfamily flavin-nucleotide-binding protein
MRQIIDLVTLPGSQGEHRLQRQYGTCERAERFYAQQVENHLNERMREFLARQEMMFVATADANGACDCTFRAGPPGFVHVLDGSCLTWPEYRGNGVMASLGNMSDNAHVGLLFVDFFRDRIGLHVNGKAVIVEDSYMRAYHPDLPVDPVPGRRAERWVVVYVDEAYIHCSKHIPRVYKMPSTRAWGTDDVRRKGGDFFGVAAGRTDARARANGNGNGHAPATGNGRGSANGHGSANGNGHAPGPGLPA